MPAQSRAQQRFMSMVRATQKGNIKAPSKEVAEVAGEMKPSSVKDFAETKHKGLPERVKKSFVCGFYKKACEAGMTEEQSAEITKKALFGLDEGRLQQLAQDTRGMLPDAPKMPSLPTSDSIKELILSHPWLASGLAGAGAGALGGAGIGAVSSKDKKKGALRGAGIGALAGIPLGMGAMYGANELGRNLALKELQQPNEKLEEAKAKALAKYMKAKGLADTVTKRPAGIDSLYSGGGSKDEQEIVQAAVKALKEKERIYGLQGRVEKDIKGAPAGGGLGYLLEKYFKRAAPRIPWQSRGRTLEASE